MPECNAHRAVIQPQVLSRDIGAVDQYNLAGIDGHGRIMNPLKIVDRFSVHGIVYRYDVCIPEY